ncbi:MAG: acyl carrier protein [Thermodesulfobacteriaceae bacterium]|nr:acyl carrier protein [Thermodesulfobacteriaceae bacterium]MCX8040933.1 acyl carrier protein [Thermodesulfobacteriaceae bacterium]MDW8135711.1 acyl carrier protein [Thermodesulfobacterium sp.]
MDIRRLCYEAILEVEDSKALDYETVTDQMEIYGEGFGLDSLGLTELINVLEEKFGLQLTMEELMEAEAFENFGALWKFIAKRVGK